MMGDFPNHFVVELDPSGCVATAPPREGAPSSLGISLTPTMTQVKFLALKNLGRLLAETADERETTDAAEPVSVGTPDRVESPGVEEDYALALRCYAAAVEIDGSDVGLWRRLGALARAADYPTSPATPSRWASPSTRGTRSCSRTSPRRSSPSATFPRVAVSRRYSPP